jgi:hypothetical protein
MNASDLIRFDEDSIRRLGDPDVWVVDPEGYEQNGRLLRDSETPRMLAYSRKEHALYMTDGCNSCEVQADLELLRADEVKEFAEENELPVELLGRLLSLL